MKEYIKKYHQFITNKPNLIKDAVENGDLSKRGSMEGHGFSQVEIEEAVDKGQLKYFSANKDRFIQMLTDIESRLSGMSEVMSAMLNSGSQKLDHELYFTNYENRLFMTTVRNFYSFSREGIHELRRTAKIGIISFQKDATLPLLEIMTKLISNYRSFAERVENFTNVPDEYFFKPEVKSKITGGCGKIFSDDYKSQVESLRDKLPFTNTNMTTLENSLAHTNYRKHKK